MGHLLALMGSGETTPTMVTTHQRLADHAGVRTGDGRAVLLDTPYGFQENADDITARALEYFATNVGAHVEHVGFRRADAVTGLAREQVRAAVRDADWLFCGPGSPTYLLRQWAPTDLGELTRGRLARDGTTVFASAAAVTVGTRSVPVYEVYKVGAEPTWAEGLDLLAGLDLRCVLIPHYDNAEGGNHDTRFCYLGERRLAQLEAELDDDEWVLGVDEHTAMVVDVDAGSFTIEGRGGVTVRARGRSEQLTATGPHRLGELATLADRLRRTGSAATTNGVSTAAADDDATPETGPPTSDDEGGAHDPLAEEVAARSAAFDTARDADDWATATGEALALEEAIRAWSGDTLTGGALDEATRELRRMLTALGAAAAAGAHDHADLLRPPVELLLDVRAEARATKDWATADRVRDALVAAQVEVRDTPDGPDWSYAG